MKRTPMKRTAFSRAASATSKSKPNRALALEERAQRAINSAAATAAMKSEQNQRLALNGKALAAIKCVASDSTAHAPIQKAEIIRSKAYLRLVAQLPCMHCGIAGHSQAAHSNTGKGMALKACDLQTFPLCCDRPGQRGCHSYFDSGALFSKEARRLIEIAWVADTQRQIYAMGTWPKNLKYPPIALDGCAQTAIKLGVK